MKLFSVWTGSVAIALLLVLAGCSDDATSTAGEGDSAADVVEGSASSGDADPASTTQATPTTESTPDSEPPSDSEPAPSTEPPPQTEPAFEPPPTVRLDDPALGVEPSDTAYRARIDFSMRAELADGTVQEGRIEGDGGKLLEPVVAHSMVVDTEGLTTFPDCLDLAAISPNWVSAYDTFYGGLGDDSGGDLQAEAMLLEAGIMSNGVLVDRYEITLDNIDPEALLSYVTITEAYIDIAREGGYLVKLKIDGQGFNNAFSVDQSEPREIRFELNFSEFNEITEFTVPEGCPVSG